MPQTIPKIQRSFSASAGHYDQFSSMHREIADKLALRITTALSPAYVLDAGCGTGYLTSLLADRFPKARVIGLDFARGMLEKARSKRGDITWIAADVHKLPFSGGNFDVLVSNLAYQWSADIRDAFTEAGRVLVPDGILACTLFGYKTCEELFQSLHEATSGALQFKRLPDMSMVLKALAIAGFKNPEISCETIKVGFKDMYELIFWLKSIGANNLPREGYAGRQAMARAAEIYTRRFAFGKGIKATFEVIRVYAKK